MNLDEEKTDAQEETKDNLLSMLMTEDSEKYFRQQSNR